MAQSPAPATGKAISVITQFRGDLEKMRPQFAMAMPAEQVDRFIRVAQTLYNNNTNLQKCSLQSVLGACMKAAQDGLLPDGREGAIVPFGADDGRAADTATWMPMVAGIRKKARNSGEFNDWYVELVHEGDFFYYQLGDEPRIDHRPSLDGGGRKRHIKFVYSIAKLKNGSTSRHVMPIQEVEDIRIRYARSKRGPWSDPIAYPEMVKKTCARQHAKTLPSSTDLDVVFHRDDHLYDLRERGNEVTRRQPRNAMAALDQFAPAEGNGNGAPPREFADDDAAPPQTDNDPGDPRPGDGTVIEGNAVAREDGRERPDVEPSAADAIAALIGKAEKHPPKNVEEFRVLANGLVDLAGTGEVDAIEKIKIWWASAAARTMRNKAGLTGENTAAIAAEIKAAIEGKAGAPAA